MFDLTDLMIWSCVIVVAVLFWRAQGVREIALKAARQYCQQMDVQWLDSHVALRGVWFKRGSDGRLHFWRSYDFEFSTTGDERYSGKIILLGKKIESIHLEPHRIQ